MALIKCSECGKEISDKAKSCPHCGAPMELISPSGSVRIKFSPVMSPTGINEYQKVSMYSNGRLLWEGKSGEVADLHFDKSTRVEIKYHTNLMYFGGTCSGVIDPQKSRKYNVCARQGMMSTKIVLQPVDTIDAD